MATVSTPERFTDNIPMSPGTSVNFINISVIKTLCIFPEVLGVKNETYVLRVGASLSNHNLIKSGIILW